MSKAPSPESKGEGASFQVLAEWLDDLKELDVKSQVSSSQRVIGV